ncbi:MAG: protein kinase [Deltaproteobacteria bacterium]|nr:protein kinase [Deltaproteobacteria bacterium]
MGTLPAPVSDALHQTLPPGTVIDGRYQVLSILGRGAMGTVYLAEHLGIGRQMALKVLHPEMGLSPALRERFNREARSTARLEHPSIVQVTDFGSTEIGAPYMVMELVRGRQLSMLSADEVSFDRAIALMQQVLRALEHAHARGVVHRDLKPDNLMLVEREGEDEVKILDFGLAVLLRPEGHPRITQAGAIFGTPRYMSPEQASGEPVDHRSDLYSVAVMLTEVLTGAVLFDGNSAAEVLGKQVTMEPHFELPYASGWNAGALQVVLKKGLSKHPRDRHQDARAFRKAITACRQNKVPETELSMAEVALVKRPNRTVRWVAAAAAVVVIAAVAIGALSRPDLEPLQAAVAKGDLDEATELAHRLLDANPRDARVHLWMGNVDFARHDVRDAVLSYQKALELGSEVAGDAHFALSVRSMVESDDPNLESMVAHLARYGGKEAAPLLAHVARKATPWPVRRTAYEGLERIGSFADLDRVDYLAGQLEDNNTRTCNIRMWYVERLIDLADPRAVPALEREAARRRCGKKEIEEALTKVTR